MRLPCLFMRCMSNRNSCVQTLSELKKIFLSFELILSSTFSRQRDAISCYKRDKSTGSRSSSLIRFIRSLVRMRVDFSKSNISVQTVILTSK
jgi:hypothetical protein